jgi:hypothetical protein
MLFVLLLDRSLARFAAAAHISAGQRRKNLKGAEEGEGRDERCEAGGSGRMERVWGERGREVV